MPKINSSPEKILKSSWKVPGKFPKLGLKKSLREGDEDEVIAKDIGDDFIERWVVTRADVAGRVFVGEEVPPIIG